jgi:hypothetical protein
LTVDSPPLICACIRNFYWDRVTFACILNCSKIINADATATRTSTDVCVCKPPSAFDTKTRSCAITCKDIPYANPNRVTANGSCICLARYDWNTDTLACDINCSLVLNADAAAPKPTGTSCVCLTGYNFNQTDGLCWVDCLLVNNSTGNAGPAACACPASFSYDAAARTCALNCTNIRFSPVGKHEFTAVPPDTCPCQTLFIWNSTANKCQVDCPNIYGVPANNTVRLTDSSCRCLPNFYWAPGYLACLPICNRFNNTNGATVILRFCVCKAGLKWRTTPLPSGCY